MIRWLFHVIGIDDASGRAYLWWSGIVGDLAIFGAVFALARKHNCHVKGCPRIGRFPVTGTAWVTCAHHHPDDPPTHGDVLASQERRPHAPGD